MHSTKSSLNNYFGIVLYNSNDNSLNWVHQQTYELQNEFVISKNNLSAKIIAVKQVTGSSSSCNTKINKKYKQNFIQSFLFTNANMEQLSHYYH